MYPVNEYGLYEANQLQRDQQADRNEVVVENEKRDEIVEEVGWLEHCHTHTHTQ